MFILNDVLWFMVYCFLYGLWFSIINVFDGLFLHVLYQLLLHGLWFIVFDMVYGRLY